MQHPEIDDDFYVTQATHGPDGQPLTQVFHCAKCNRCLPPDKFKRAMTPAEAKYRGYSGARKVFIETQHCADCRPRRRRLPESFTTPELKRKAERGEISPIVAKGIADKRQRRALAEQKAAANKRWDIATAKTWEPLIDALRAEVHAVTQQRKYARTKAKGTSATAQAAHIEAFAETYLDLLRRIRAEFTLAMRSAKLKAEKSWQEYVTPEERTHLAALWSVIEPNVASRLRVPAVFVREAGVHIPIVQPEEKGTVTSSEGQTSSAQPDGPEPTAWEDF